jgi:osmotically inducible protein OsmC
MIHTATAHWQRNSGKNTGALIMQSFTLDENNFNLKGDFGREIQANPEVLLAAAHAGSFTLAVVSLLGQKGITPITLETQADLTLVDADITAIHLSINGQLDDINAEDFATITKEAGINCFISKIIKVPVTSEVHFIT